ncbi:hypothetical protein PAXINDRAFT_100405 [Paxillus involutus ATCC 200175]|uniref:F-box domain-containing protein n=1 Tax=Paxillus involutus ATCC 200175 TaxID=664439 RepID=A0A0C9TUF1_PAXIN|nr:hypothetical protein PAXINDRAFT_100405 [Paxillus involutus ATCC 200175]
MATLRGSYACKKQPTDPLKVLPPELVGYIFHLWLLDGVYPRTKHSYSQLQVLLCLVSRSWRDFVYASPHLWADIIFRTSQGAVSTLHALKQRLERSQDVPLSLGIVAHDGRADEDALRVLFAESSRFRHLTLGISDLSWCNNIQNQVFTQLSELTVYTRLQTPAHMDVLSAIFSSAPHLRHVNLNLHCIGDPGPIEVNGRQLHSFYLNGTSFPVESVFEFLASCPNLRNAVIRLEGGQDYIPMMERISLPKLRSLSLEGTEDVMCLLGGIQAPLLSRLDMTCRNNINQKYGSKVLEALLASCSHLEEIALNGVLTTENRLINCITNNQNLVKFTVTCPWWQTSFITHKTFQLLTWQEHGRYVLPHLEKLIFLGRHDVPDEVVLRMIESRMSPPDDKESSSHSHTLKSIRMDGCRPMAEESISRLQAICRESGLKAEGSFIDPSQNLTFDLY